MRTMKVNGMTVEGLPARAVLEHDDTPAPVVEALADYDAARVAYGPAAATLRDAEREAREAIPDGDPVRDRAAIVAVTETERADERRATSAARRASRALIEVLEEHRVDVDAVAARLALTAHVEEVKAAVSAHEAHEESRAGLAGLTVPRHPLLAPHDDHGTIQAGARRSALEVLDLVNTAHLVEVAGGEPGDYGLVEVRGERGGLIYTTPARARMLTAAKTTHHGRRWALVDEIEEA